jgi:hypothetical protein
MVGGTLRGAGELVKESTGRGRGDGTGAEDGDAQQGRVRIHAMESGDVRAVATGGGWSFVLAGFYVSGQMVY